MLLWHSDRYRCDRFLRAMAINIVILIIMCRLRLRHVHTDRPVVTNFICWYIDRNPKHAQLVLQFLYYLHCIIHFSKIWYKRWCLNWVLPLSEPDYWPTVEKNSITVWDRLVSVSPAWFTSTKQCVNIKLPLETGIYSGIASSESL